MGKIKYLLLAILISTSAWGKNNLVGEPSVLVFNITQNKIEYSRNADIVRPVASITKIMTAMVTLDQDKDLGKTLRLSNRVGSYLPSQNYNRYQL